MSQSNQVSFNGHLLHDLRTPIQMLNTLGNSQNLPQDIREHLSTCTQYLEGIVSRCFGLEDKAQDSNSINKVIHQKTELFARENIQFHMALHAHVDELSFLAVNALDFNRILFNIIGNSIKEFQVNAIETPLITIESHNCEKYFYLSLSDNGCGFPPELLDGSTNLPTPRGLGIGLSCVKKILQESGGELLLKNSPFGGAEVHLQIPLVSYGKKDVVLFEDEPLFIRQWENTFKNSLVSLKVNPQELPAKDALIFVDVQLKDQSGLDIAQKLFALGYTNIFLTTSYAPEDFSNVSYIKGVIGKNPPDFLSA